MNVLLEDTTVILPTGVASTQAVVSAAPATLVIGLWVPDVWISMSVLPGPMVVHVVLEGVETLLALTPAIAIRATDLSTAELAQI